VYDCVHLLYMAEPVAVVSQNVTLAGRVIKRRVRFRKAKDDKKAYDESLPGDSTRRRRWNGREYDI